MAFFTHTPYNPPFPAQKKKKKFTKEKSIRADLEMGADCGKSQHLQTGICRNWQKWAYFGLSQAKISNLSSLQRKCLKNKIRHIYGQTALNPYNAISPQTSGKEKKEKIFSERGDAKYLDTPRRVVRPHFPPGASRSPSNRRRTFCDSYNIRPFGLVYSYKLTFLRAF